MMESAKLPASVPPPDFTLPAAVPPPDITLADALAAIGALTLRVQQLERVIQERAIEANTLHDQIELLQGPG